MALRRIQKEIKDIKKEGVFKVEQVDESNGYKYKLSDFMLFNNKLNIIIEFSYEHPFKPFKSTIENTTISLKQFAYEQYGPNSSLTWDIINHFDILWSPATTISTYFTRLAEFSNEIMKKQASVPTSSTQVVSSTTPVQVVPSTDVPSVGPVRKVSSTEQGPHVLARGPERVVSAQTGGSRRKSKGSKKGSKQAGGSRRKSKGSKKGSKQAGGSRRKSKGSKKGPK